MNPVAQKLAVTSAQGMDGVQAARDAAREAAQLVDALEEQVRDGNPVQPADLANARELARIAELRVEAAERAAIQALTEARHRAYAAHGETVAQGQREVDGIDAAITAAFNQAKEALSDLWRLAEQRSEQVARLSAEQSRVIEVARTHGEIGMLPKLLVTGRDAPNAELAALPLDCLLTEKLAEHRVNGGQAHPWSRALLNVRAKHAREAYPHLAGPDVNAQISRLWNERRNTGSR